DRACVEHRLEHDVPPGERPIHADGWRVSRRGLHEAREQRRLGHAHLRGVLAKVSTRRRFDAVEAVAEIHLVQIELEDFLLGIEPLDARGEDELLYLPVIRLVRGEEALAREL